MTSKLGWPVLSQADTGRFELYSMSTTPARLVRATLSSVVPHPALTTLVVGRSRRSSGPKLNHHAWHSATAGGTDLKPPDVGPANQRRHLRCGPYCRWIELSSPHDHDTRQASYREAIRVDPSSRTTLLNQVTVEAEHWHHCSRHGVVVGLATNLFFCIYYMPLPTPTAPSMR